MGRGIHNEIPPITLAFWRWAVALIIILPFSIGHIIRQKDLIKQNWKILSLLAYFSVTNFSICIYLALKSSTVTTTVLINSMTPIFIVIVSWLGLKERINLRQAIGIAVSLAGLIFIITGGNLSSLAAVQFSRGDMWTISAGIGWALYSVLQKKCPLELNSLTFLATTIIIGTIFIFPFYVWEISTGKRMIFSQAAIISIIYVALFASILAYIFWNKSIQIIGANKTGIFIHLMPVFSIILAIIFLDETLKGFHIKGTVLIFLGIFLTTANKIKLQKVGIKKIITVIIAYLCMTTTPAWGQDAMEFYNRGLNSSLTYKKIAYFTEALQLNPNLAEAYEQRALNYYFRRWFDHAIQDYIKVIEFKPYAVDAYLMLGQAYLWKSKGRWMKGDINKLASHLRKQQIPEYMESLDRAIENISRAIELDPQLASAYSHRAEAYRIKGMTQWAIRDAATAIELHGDRRSIAKAHATLSRIYRQQDQDELSEVHFRKSIELDPYLSDFPPLHVPLMHPGFGNTSRPKSVGRLGFFGIIILVLVVIFKLALPAPSKRDK